MHIVVNPTHHQSSAPGAIGSVQRVSSAPPGRRSRTGARKVIGDELRYPVTGIRMKSIDEHIQKDQSEIEAAKAAGDLGKVRHLEEELQGLKEFKEHHPEDSHDPTPLEVFCDLNPSAPECRVYDD